MKIYLAGPLFSNAERALLDTVAARLRSEGFEVFVPHEQFAEQKFMRSDGGSAKESAIPSSARERRRVKHATPCAARLHGHRRARLSQLRLDGHPRRCATILTK
jgi:hypothetical protein